MIQTRLTRLLGIEKPILCGGLMWLATAEYVAACVNAGAMGYITPRSYPDEPALRDALRRCRDLTGGRPFGLNLYISARPEENARMERWCEVVAEEGVAHVETAGYSPKRFLPALRHAGATVIHKSTTARHALAAARAGVDGVVLIGSECGGHPGEGDLSAMTLAALVLDRVDVPVMVGGGIGSGRQIAAALAMGADGVLIGSRMLVADEIPAHGAYKDHVASLDETASTTVLRSVGNTYRCLRNGAADAVAALEAGGERDWGVLGPHVGGAAQKRAYDTGDWSEGILSLGPAAAWADRREPAAAILGRLMAEAEAALDRVGARRAPAAEAAE